MVDSLEVRKRVAHYLTSLIDANGLFALGVVTLEEKDCIEVFEYDLKQALRNAATPTWAKVSWTIDDVHTMAQQMKIKLTDDEAETFLQNNQSQIQQDAVERAWDSIGTLLAFAFPDRISGKEKADGT